MKQTKQSDARRVERGGMIIVFCIGLILVVGGLLFAWKIGVLWDSESFFGHEIHTQAPWHRDERRIDGVLNLPWALGFLMICASVKHLWKNRTK